MNSSVQSLIVVPTELELQHVGSIFDAIACRVELCGFGLVAAAARTAFLVEQLQPQRVILCGIAGSYGSDLPVGQAFQFRRVACYGIGTGQGNAFLSVEQMGWKQWEHEPRGLDDELPLTTLDARERVTADMLVSVAAASMNGTEVDQKRRIYPQAVAEDMEGYAVASAARLAGIPVSIVRGVSNKAGDRRIDQWQIAPAMAAAAQLVRNLIEETEG